VKKGAEGKISGYVFPTRLGSSGAYDGAYGGVYHLHLTRREEKTWLTTPSLSITYVTRPGKNSGRRYYYVPPLA
jgi:hypothetical protein